MRYIFWIGAILITGVFTVVVGGMLVHYFADDVGRLTIYDAAYWLSTAVLALCFGLFVLLSGRLTPFNKAAASSTALIVSFAFIVMGIIQHVMDDGFLKVEHWLRYSIFVMVMIAFYLFSKKRLLE